MDKYDILCAVIADDITGANDIGVMFAKNEIETVIYSYNANLIKSSLEHTVTILDTDSRFLDKNEAYSRVYNSVKSFDKNKVKMFYNKQCSVFRGNIGPEFDAMLDALGEECAMVIAGFPDNGRTTINGIHYVNNVKLSESQFKNDPVNPMYESDLVKIIGNQTSRKVGLINYQTLDLGLDALKKEIQQKKMEYNYIVFDVRDNHDLEIIAQAIVNEKIVCGSSAVAYYIGLLNKDYMETVTKKITRTDDKTLVIAGSLTPQTKKQIEYMREKNYPTIMLNTRSLFNKSSREDEILRVVDNYEEEYLYSRIVLVYSLNLESEVEETKNIGFEHGYNTAQISKLVSSTLAEIGLRINKTFNTNKFIICGGDTSASFCEKMNINGMRVIEEVQAGLATCEAIKDDKSMSDLKFILKSGSFGSDDFIEIASTYL